MTTATMTVPWTLALYRAAPSLEPAQELKIKDANNTMSSKSRSIVIPSVPNILASL